MTPFRIWFVALTIGAIAGWAIGNDPRFTLGLYVVLVGTFRFGQLVEREELRDASS